MCVGRGGCQIENGLGELGTWPGYSCQWNSSEKLEQGTREKPVLLREGHSRL